MTNGGPRPGHRFKSFNVQCSGHFGHICSARAAPEPPRTAGRLQVHSTRRQWVLSGCSRCGVERAHDAAPIALRAPRLRACDSQGSNSTASHCPGGHLGSVGLVGMLPLPLHLEHDWHVPSCPSCLAAAAARGRDVQADTTGGRESSRSSPLAPSPLSNVPTLQNRAVPGDVTVTRGRRRRPRVRRRGPHLHRGTLTSDEMHCFSPSRPRRLR